MEAFHPSRESHQSREQRSFPHCLSRSWRCPRQAIDSASGEMKFAGPTIQKGENERRPISVLKDGQTDFRLIEFVETSCSDFHQSNCDPDSNPWSRQDVAIKSLVPDCDLCLCRFSLHFQFPCSRGQRAGSTQCNALSAGISFQP